MFESTECPRIYGLPPGVDFGAALVGGLLDRQSEGAPEALANVVVYVNTARMQRRIREIFDAGTARLLPRIRLITDLALDPAVHDLPPPVSSLRRRLELSQFVAALLGREPGLAARSSLYDLSDSLARLMDEMQGEGVSPAKLQTLDITDQSGHWDRALKFLGIINAFYDGPDRVPDMEARQRQVIEALTGQWKIAPPAHPIIVAGSTGSRGATGLLMQAVARLPQGAVVLPGYDFHVPEKVWQSFEGDGNHEDHPQFRFHKLLSALGVNPVLLPAWSSDPPPQNDRNRLVSLALRPAPVTDQWLTDGPDLGDLNAATDAITLVEAPSPRAEAEAIALRLRQAAQDGITAALITPDRMLTRQVAASLDRWELKPDDSAGLPLALSPPGRFLRHVADGLSRPMTGEALLVLLKHPLCNSDGEDRGSHLLNTRILELYLRRYGPPIPTTETVTKWLADQDIGKADWAEWLSTMIASMSPLGDVPLVDHVECLIDTAERWASGPTKTGTGGLWDETAGRAARQVSESLRREADAGGVISSTDFAMFFGGILAEGEVRNRDSGHPNILFWGTLEARVQSAELVILGGLNEGTWPEAPSPDPWLNRKMRADVGLLLPERRIGLSAHDFQQAIAGREVWITRAIRSSDAETVPSRWLNRLFNLMGGLPDQNGPSAIEAMRARGNSWLAMAAGLTAPDQTVDLAKRPSPRPPVSARPKELSVTRLKTLIRDPYAIYAEKVLRLRPLDPLVPKPEAPLRGIIYHEILEKFIDGKPDATDPDSLQVLLTLAQKVLDRACPWPTIRALWFANFTRVARPFLEGEARRQARGSLAKTEAWGEVIIPGTGVKITCKADRIDLTPDGSALIYDYKTGQVPTTNIQKKFDKQLLVEAAMVERGAFKDIGARMVTEAVFIGVNAAMKDVPAPLTDLPPDAIWAELETHFAHWADVKNGYTARRAPFQAEEASYYDHLSRFGEWKSDDDPEPEDLS